MYGVDDALVDVLRPTFFVFEWTVQHFNGISATLDRDYRSRCFRRSEVLAKTFCIDRCRRDDQPQILSLLQQSVQHPQQKVDVQRPLVCFIQNDDFVLLEEPIAGGFREQDSIGHQLDVRVLGGFVIETNFVAYGLAERRLQLFRDSGGNTPRGDAAWLRVPDHARNTVARVETDLGQLRGLTRTCFAGDDDHLVICECRDNVVSILHDWQFVRKSDFRF